MSNLLFAFKYRALAFIANRFYSDEKGNLASYFKKKLAFLQNVKTFFDGYDSFLKMGKTSQEAYLSLVYLYAATNGKFNEEVNAKICDGTFSAGLVNTSDEIFGTLGKKEYRKINDVLREDGYFYFARKLSPATCGKLIDFALRTPAAIHGNDSKMIYDPAKPVAEIYRFEMNDLMNNEDVQRLMGFAFDEH